MSEALDVVVVGGGHNGLAAATTIARRGHRVAVFERRGFAGGAVATEELVPGYRFSSCSYITHMLHERVIAELDIARHFPPIHVLGPTIDVLPDGRVFRSSVAPLETAETAATLFGEEVADAYLRWDRRWDDAAAHVDRFLLGPAPTAEHLVAEASGSSASSTVELFANTSYRSLLEASFPEDVRCIFAPNLDGSPDTVGAPLTQAYYATERRRDPHYQGVPEGGMGAIARGFERAAVAAGVAVHCDAPVSDILIRHGRVTGVRLESGRVVSAPVVVSNADPKRTMLRLVDPTQLTARTLARVRRLDSSPGGVKIHFALRREPDLRRILGDRPPEMLGLINLYPTHDWYLRAPVDRARRAFPRNAFLQLQTPTFVDKTLTAPGRHVLSIFIPHVASRLRGRGWAARRWEIAWIAVQRVAELIPNLRECLDGLIVFSPEELEDRVGLTDGNIRHLGHRPGQAYADRPTAGWSDGTTPVDGLFLCGAGVHPGGEVSGVPGYRVGLRVSEMLTASHSAPVPAEQTAIPRSA